MTIKEAIKYLEQEQGTLTVYQKRALHIASQYTQFDNKSNKPSFVTRLKTNLKKDKIVQPKQEVVQPQPVQQQYEVQKVNVQITNLQLIYLGIFFACCVLLILLAI